MSAVFPSQIVEFITQRFKTDDFQPMEVALNLRRDHIFHGCVALLKLCKEVPPHLITIGSRDYALLITNISIIESELKRLPDVAESYSVQIRPLSSGDKNPVLVLRDLYAKCADEAPHPRTPTLRFIGDASLRESLRADIDSAHSDLEAQRWKAATVLAGSAIEGLFLWALEDAAFAPALPKAIVKCKPKHSEPERWDLGEYIRVAKEVQLIDDENEKQCELCKDFRNLIHPGKAQRTQRTATRGRAMGALAAVELLVERLTSRFPDVG